VVSAGIVTKSLEARLSLGPVRRIIKAMSKQKRIGIYAGTFDPVHSGHIAFALQAVAAARLDKVYFIPERQPRGKSGVEHFGHRVAMLQRATQPHRNFGVLELVDVNFSVVRTLPKLEHQFTDARLVFLFGSDAVDSMPVWPNIERLLSSAELVIGLRDDHQEQALREYIAGWSLAPKALTVFTSYAPDVSSGRVREALYRRQPVRGLLRSVERYSNRNWLYVSVGY